MAELKLCDAGPSEAGWHLTESINVCPRQYQLSVLGAANAARKAASDPAFAEMQTMKPVFARGSINHVGLAHFYLQATKEAETWYKPHDAIDAYAEKNKPIYPGNDWDGLAAAAHGVLDTYMLKYKGDLTRFEVLGIEEEQRMKVTLPETGEKFLFTQRVDAIFRDKRTDTILYVDHKTTSRVDTRSNKGFAQSGQFAGYDIFGKLRYGTKYEGPMLNIVVTEMPYNHIRPTFERGNGPAYSIIETIRMAYRRRIEFRERYGDPTENVWPGVFSSYAPCRHAFGFCDYWDFCNRYDGHHPEVQLELELE